MIKRILLALPLLIVPSLAFGLPPYLGDFQDGSTTHQPTFYFDARAQDPPIAEAITSGDFVLINAAGTEDGDPITWTASVNSRNTGRIIVDLEDDFITAGEYACIIDVGTADGIALEDMVLFSFSVGRYADVNVTDGVVEASLVDVLPAPTAPPGPTPTIQEALAWLSWLSQAKMTTTGGLRRWFAPDESTVIAEENLSDNGATMTKGETGAP